MRMEIDKLKDLNFERELLKRRYDFSRIDLFNIIDVYRCNSLLRSDLRNFINRNGFYVN